MPSASITIRRRIAHCLRLLLAWAMCMLALPAAQAGEPAPLVLRDDVRVVDLWPHLQLREDPDGTLTANDVLADTHGFAPTFGRYANLGLYSGAIWLRTRVQVPADGSGRWLFDLDYPAIDTIDLFLVTRGRVTQRIRLGDSEPLSRRPLPTRSHAAPLVMERGQTHELLIRVQTSSAYLLPVKLYEVHAYYAHEASIQALQALFAGIWVCLCLYSLTQAFVLRDAMFVYYAISTLSVATYCIGFTGVGAQHLWGDNDWLSQNLPPLAVLIGVASALLFVDRALDVPQLSRRVALAARVLATIAGGSALAFAVGAISYRGVSQVAMALGLSPMLVAVPMAYLRWRGGDRAASYMLWGWAVYAVGAASQALLLRGVVDLSFWSQHALQFTSTIEMVLWMLLLGARVHAIRSRAEAAHRERDLLQALAHTDPLTGLLNRRGLRASIDDRLRASTPLQATGIYVLDLDGFKPINDALGHDAGDELLCRVADRLKSQLRATDLLARLGGDEFVVAAGNLPTEIEAAALGRKLLRAFQDPFEVGGRACHVGLTIGYAIAPHDGYDLSSLLKRADSAMYAGKQAGKNCVHRGAASAGLVAG
ncbi:MAG: GGDEF domain-containing protein [Burkholderiaceae bacterium]|nr:GGDEF domain-containing protein [Burkholderiaceae bacterium]